MIFSQYFHGYIPKFQQQLLKWNPSIELSLRGIQKLSYITGEECYLRLCREYEMRRRIYSTVENRHELAIQGNFLFWLYDQTKDNQILEEIKRIFSLQSYDEIQWSDKLYAVLVFCLTYETQLNRKKGYGDIIKWIQKLDEQSSISSVYLAALVDCYEIMTEESYDQREAFAFLFRKGLKKSSDSLNIGVECFDIKKISLLSYCIMKGISHDILARDIFYRRGIDLLLMVQCNGILYEKGSLFLHENSQVLTGDREAVAVGACMIAWSEYLLLEGGEPR